MSKKAVIKVLLCILVIFILTNVCWYAWRAQKYGSFSKGMEEQYFSTWIVPRYKTQDKDRFDYGVKYPEYLSLTGNLSVGFPATEENPSTDFLIVWPKAFGGYNYGVSISEGETSYQIYINPDGSTVYSEDREVVARNRERINTLLKRGKEMWSLE